MTDKSYVTLAVCPICHEETGTLLLDTRLRDSFENHTVTPEPCDKCREKYLTNGVMLFNPRSGSLVVLKVEAFTKMFNVPVPEKHIAFCDEDVFVQLGVQQ